MDASDIIRLLSTHHYAPANLEEVKDLCRNYPEFNLAHMLKVRIMESLGHPKEKELKVAAVYSSNRMKLHQLVTEVLDTPAPQATPAPQVSPASEVTPAPGPEATPVQTTVEIEFSDADEVHADVIIKQHAPYAGPEPGEELLELVDEEEEEELLILDTEDTSSAPDAEPSPGSEPSPESKATQEGAPRDSQPEDSNLIQNFLKVDPGPIRASKKSNLKGDVSLSSIREHDGFITDTLAKIYVKQGLVAKAIYAYEKLSLKYPEKSAYFAAQIEKVKNTNRS